MSQTENGRKGNRKYQDIKWRKVTEASLHNFFFKNIFSLIATDSDLVPCDENSVTSIISLIERFIAFELGNIQKKDKE